MNLLGSIVALVTPMEEDGSIDYQALSQLVEFHISNGTHGIVAVGTTGESATVNIEEHLSIIEHIVNAVAGRVSVIAGTGANSTKEAIYLTKEADKLNADGVLLVVPYYNKPTQEGLFQHYKSIAEAVPIAQIMYNVPGRTVADMSNETIARLADIDNIIACKDATGDLVRGKQLIDLCGDKINIFSGDDMTALGLMKLGGKGDISVTANIAPAQMSQMCSAALEGDFARAEEIDQQLQPLHKNLFVESNPIPVKYAVSRMGFGSNTLRLPLTSLSQPATDVLDQALKPFIAQS